MDADPAVSADLVLVALDAPRSHPPHALPHVTRHGPGRRRSGRFAQLRKEPITSIKLTESDHLES